MAKTVAGQRSVCIAAAIVFVVTTLWALLFVPRLGVHPEAIKEGVDRSSEMFFEIQLIAAIALLVVVIISRRGGRIIYVIISGLLYLAAGLLLLHDFMVFDGAVYYLQNYIGFFAEAILMLACVGANLIAAILAIIAGNKYRKMALPRAGERPDEREGSK